MKLTDSIYMVASGKWGFAFSHELDCNVFLVDTGDGCVMIDSGVGLDTDRMDKVISSHGFKLHDIKKLILTHYHGDHACGAARIQAASGCEVFAPEREASAIANGDEKATSVAGAKGGLYPADFSYPKCSNVTGLSDEASVSQGQITFTMHMVPGHSLQDMTVSAKIDDMNCLFSGDSVFAAGQVLIQSLYDVSLYPYAQGMNRLASLEVDALFPGHGVFVLENGHDHIQRAADKFNSGLIPPQLYYFA